MVIRECESLQLLLLTENRLLLQDSLLFAELGRCCSLVNRDLDLPGASEVNRGCRATDINS